VPSRATSPKSSSFSSRYPIARFQPDKKTFFAEERILSDRLYADERPILLDFLGRLRGVKTPEDYFPLQLDLFRRFKMRQDQIAESSASSTTIARKCASSRAPKLRTSTRFLRHIAPRSGSRMSGAPVELWVRFIAAA
jgi:hypothetical protein